MNAGLAERSTVLELRTTRPPPTNTRHHVSSTEPSTSRISKLSFAAARRWPGRSSRETCRRGDCSGDRSALAPTIVAPESELRPYEVVGVERFQLRSVEVELRQGHAEQAHLNPVTAAGLPQTPDAERAAQGDEGPVDAPAPSLGEHIGCAIEVDPPVVRVRSGGSRWSASSGRNTSLSGRSMPSIGSCVWGGGRRLWEGRRTVYRQSRCGGSDLEGALGGERGFRRRGDQAASASAKRRTQRVIMPDPKGFWIDAADASWMRRYTLVLASAGWRAQRIANVTSTVATISSSPPATGTSDEVAAIRAIAPSGTTVRVPPSLTCSASPATPPPPWRARMHARAGVRHRPLERDRAPRRCPPSPARGPDVVRSRRDHLVEERAKGGGSSRTVTSTWFTTR